MADLPITGQIFWAVYSMFKLLFNFIMLSPFVTIPLIVYTIIEIILLTRGDTPLLFRLIKKMFVKEVKDE